MTPPAAFEAPWHAQAFALAVALNEAGHFSWPDWTVLFGAELEQARQHGPLDGSDDYYIAWVAALEQMLTRIGMADAGLLAVMKANWEDAFLSTPHGQPVTPRLPAVLA